MKTKEELSKQLLDMKFAQTTANTFKKEVDGKMYLVDFKNKQVCRQEGEYGMTRIDNDEEDATLVKLQELCDYVVEPTSDDVPEEIKDDIVDQPTEQETMPVAVKKQVRQMQKMDSDLTNENVRKYICPTATDQEIFMFLKLCEERHLNPFIKEAYLVKYNNSPATLIVGKDAFTKKAEDNPQFDGFEAGIVVEYENADKDGHIYDRKQGTLVCSGEKIIGGWAKVFRKDRRVPFFAEVSMGEYDTGKSSWAKIPATMIRKVAIVQALREAFPSDLGGCYDSSEMDQARRD